MSGWYYSKADYAQLETALGADGWTAHWVSPMVKALLKGSLRVTVRKQGPQWWVEPEGREAVAIVMAKRDALRSKSSEDAMVEAVRRLHPQDEQTVTFAPRGLLFEDRPPPLPREDRHTTITIKQGEPKSMGKTSVAGVSVGPLAVHRPFTPSGAGKGWMVSHSASGAGLPFTFQSMDAAKEFAAKLQDLPWNEITDTAKSQKDFVKKYKTQVLAAVSAMSSSLMQMKEDTDSSPTSMNSLIQSLLSRDATRVDAVAAVSRALKTTDPQLIANEFHDSPDYLELKDPQTVGLIVRSIQRGVFSDKPHIALSTEFKEDTEGPPKPMKFPHRKGRPTVDPRGAHVTMTYKGRRLLGLVRDVYYSEFNGAAGFRLRVTHMNGEPWPFDPDTYIVDVLPRDYEGQLENTAADHPPLPAGATKSAHHLGFSYSDVDVQWYEYYTLGQEVYRAPLSNVMDLTTKSRMGRFVTSVGQWPTYQTAFGIVLENAQPMGRPEAMTERARQSLGGLGGRGGSLVPDPSKDPYAAPLGRLVEAVMRPVQEADEGLPEIVTLAVKGTLNAKDPNYWSWVFFHASTRAERDAFDDYLVRIKHPLAYEAGTQEQRFRAFTQEQVAAVLQGRIRDVENMLGLGPQESKKPVTEEVANGKVTVAVPDGYSEIFKWGFPSDAPIARERALLLAASNSRMSQKYVDMHTPEGSFEVYDFGGKPIVMKEGDVNRKIEGLSREDDDRGPALMYDPKARYRAVQKLMQGRTEAKKKKVKEAQYSIPDGRLTVLSNGPPEDFSFTWDSPERAVTLEKARRRAAFLSYRARQVVPIVFYRDGQQVEDIEVYGLDSSTFYLSGPSDRFTARIRKLPMTDPDREEALRGDWSARYRAVKTAHFQGYY